MMEVEEEVWPAETPAREELLAQLTELRASSPRMWKLEVASSLVSDGGLGVHLRGACSAGTVLTLYPGVSFLTDDLPVMHQLVLPGNTYVLARRDGVLLDGRHYGQSRQIFESALQRDRAQLRVPPEQRALSSEAALGQEHAVGNMVNHPPAGTSPNVSAAPLDLWEGESDGLATSELLACVVPFRLPAPGGPAKQTVVLVASRAMCDEELLLDYKLRPQGPLEPWYAPVVK
uniref:SET domain-containing protein n=1 Tax=Coccolithus braarudii TaxID=221442 RepID=A0A7S0L5I1_9EUKA|mmetsp:Transcript_16372/g.35493  ORF Transcript_16372/g.35493 Transcript_16372/m.35493 type:complete len:232 (+) Transcript_16372:53-748(+)